MTTTTQSNQAIDGFHPKNSTVSVSYHPSPPATPPTRLIILCTWFGAAPKHIAVYTRGYRTLYPSATILLCQSTPATMLSSSPDLEAAADLVLAELHRHPALPTHLHAFSNGGATTAVHLLTRLTTTTTTTTTSPRPLPPHALRASILDCCPGTAGLTTATRAISFAAPAGWRRAALAWPVWLALAAYMAWHVATGAEDAISWVRRRLNEPDLMPGYTAGQEGEEGGEEEGEEGAVGGRPRRLYLYSKKDELVDAADVAAHAKALRERDEDGAGDGQGRGLLVREDVWENAKHCALVVEDAERYWAVVGRFVEGLRDEPVVPWRRSGD